MSYQEFLEQICEAIKEELPESHQMAEVILTTVRKNNNMIRDAIVINNQGSPIVPQIYMDAYFSEFESGRSMKSIATEVVKAYLKQEMHDIENLPTQVLDYQQIKENLIVQLVNKDTNEELLKHIPHQDMENSNLTATLRVSVGETGIGRGTFQVTNKMLELWGIEAETIHQDALNNMRKNEPAQLFNIEQVIFNPLGLRPSGPNPPEETKMEPHGLYILSNKSEYWGAAVLLYPDVLQGIAENAESNLFIIPSSIHEVLLMTDTGEMNAEELQTMVITINHQQVPQEDVLSNEVYYYDKEEQSLSMATTKEKTEELMKRILPAEAEEQFERDEFFER